MYKLIAIDMDGTLLNSKKELTKETKDALIAARKKGVYIVLASGRPTEGIMSFVNELELNSDDDYVLSYNGCLVQKTKSKEIISNTTLTGKELKYLYGISKELNLNIHAFSEKRGLITPKHSKYTYVEAELNGIDISIVDFDTVPDDEIIVKVMMIDEPSILDAGMKHLPKEVYDIFSIAKSTPYFLEFFNKESNKFVGVSKLAEYLGIKNEEVITIGDAMNDFPMIEQAGLGIAMGNAVDKIKEVSKYITDTNDNNGVAKAVEKFILNV